ncbi:MAG: hypothetical protein ACPLPW_08870, partial [bacterium]
GWSLSHMEIGIPKEIGISQVDISEYGIYAIAWQEAKTEVASQYVDFKSIERRVLEWTKTYNGEDWALAALGAVATILPGVPKTVGQAISQFISGILFALQIRIAMQGHPIFWWNPLISYVWF